MITQAQAQEHADMCGAQGTAIPIPVQSADSMYWMAQNAINPENMEVMIWKGHGVTGYVLNALAQVYGLDYVCVEI